MTHWSLLLALATAAAPAAAGAAEPPAKATPEQVEFFEKKVRPVLADNCYSCHGPKKQNGGLRLDTAAGLKAGADDGAVIVPGDPVKSRLLKSVRYENDFKMPPKKQLPAEAIAVLAEWVKGGAVAPEDAAAGSAAADPKSHWAFKPIKNLPVPQVAGAATPIDAFVLAKLTEAKLAPAPLADRRTLVRRAYLDLIGLPPTAAEVEAFERDADPRAWEKVIDHLLASPQYGQRWGRYWLDLARYADTKGYVFNEDRNYPFAYTYRDYVVRSLNEDKPYDQFVTEQLAADRLNLGDDKRPLAALGFLTLGRRFLGNTHDIIDDRIDVVTRGLMGLSVGCARCHDHKFDPIPATDYYSLYGIFASTSEPKDLPLIGEVKRTPEVVAFEAEVAKREGEYKAELQKRYAATLKKLRDPAAVADYLRAVIELRKTPDAQIGNAIRERDLLPFVFNRWKAFLAPQFKAWSPVYGPLAALADVSDKVFAETAVEVVAALAKDPKTPVNPLVLKGLIDAKPPTFKAAAEAVVAVLTAKPPEGEPSKDQAEVFKAWGAGGPLDIAITDFDKIQNRADRDALTAIQKKTDSFKATNPFAPPRAHVLADKSSPFQSYVFLRGNPGNRGPSVPLQAPAITSPGRKPFTDGSGRLELARAIASPENPLTARVLVNRVWAGHFGHGFVRTPSDFGVRSDPPSHPELLDWLATQFVKDGWSLKKLHKLMMTSAAYQRSSVTSAEAFRLDTENKLLSHQNPRRLDFEAMRDSLLAASGKIDLALEGRPVDLFKAPFTTRRSIYGMIDRTNFPGTMRAFDVASPDTHSPQRFQTTAPQQALFLMNSPFVAEQARNLAARPEVAAAKTPEDKAVALYRLALSRNPTKAELALALEFAADDDPKAAFSAWPQLAQTLLLCNEFVFID
ncbi:PSD1 and planctomycete cytochrome C domain-containing protein [Gemmata sp.]|uniref:PSD1 and planctomycete cytochrome C domain-containing protein n=1 Tax=Gemmata sp. TaxID=1914242 RepID=UPI003F71D86E